VGLLAHLLCQTVSAVSVTGFSPSFGQPGNVINIFGTGLSGASVAEFNYATPTPGDFVVVSDSQLQVVVPIGATSGSLAVVVGGIPFVSPSPFQVAPVVTNFNPQSGIAGTQLAIFGANFNALSTTVVFSGTNASVKATFIAPTEVAVIVPTNAATGPITIMTSAGTNVSTNIFTTGTLPTIAGFSPIVGTNGASVLISGSNFLPPAIVTFNGVTAKATITASTQLSAIVPAGATTGPISITTSNGMFTTSSNFITSAGPIITNFSPTIGEANTAVTISGFNLPSATSVTFNGKAGTITGYSANSLEVFPPAGSGVGPVEVFTPSGNFTTSNYFTNATGPIITDFSPTLGPVGSAVAVDGINFTSATTLKFGNVAASPKLVSATQLSVLVPAGAVTSPISVSGNSTTYTSSSNFTVTTTKPVITSIVPPSGVRGQSVRINGANFTNLTASAVQFDGVTTTYQPPTSTTVLTPVVPAGASTGYVTVNNTSGSGVSAALFYLQPWITGFGAPGGIVNSTLLLNGRSLTNVSSVTVNGIAYEFTNSNTQIGAVIPTNATTGLVEIVTPGGIFISTNQFAILPKIYSFSPVIGPAGTVVTIDGTSLFNVNKVEFGGVSATPTFVSTNEVQVAVPSGAESGPLTVFTQYGSDISSNDFTATKPTLLFLRKSVFPTLATTNDEVTFTLTVTNSGPSIATSLIVTDSIPAGLIVFGANATVGSITNRGGNLLWTFPILDTNDSAKMQVFATASAPAAITNLAHLGFAEGNLNTDSNFSFAFSYFVNTAQQTISVQVETNSDQLLLSWPVSPAAFGLEISTNLAVSNAWQFAPIFITNGLNCFTDTISGPAKFYRLAW
jgi:uncharacterized repeat protein (TIGR01451 family)